jgi:TRAP-type mannitol/chloroaromatic compound transport system permease small subunit
VEVYLMIGTAFFSGLVAHIQRRHLRMDVLRRRFPPAIARLVDGTKTLLAIAVCALTTWISWAYTIRIFRIGSHSENAHIPMWIPHRVLAVSLQLRSGGGRGARAHVMRACIVMARNNARAVSEKPSTIDSSSPDLSPLPATNDKAIATGAKPRSINLIIMSVG